MKLFFDTETTAGKVRQFKGDGMELILTILIAALIAYVIWLADRD